MLKNGADIRYIQEMLGHEKLVTTQGYTRVVKGDLKRMLREYHPREGEANE
jgi:site-specific recombinase XerD